MPRMTSSQGLANSLRLSAALRDDFSRQERQDAKGVEKATGQAFVPLASLCEMINIQCPAMTFSLVAS